REDSTRPKRRKIGEDLRDRRPLQKSICVCLSPSRLSIRWLRTLDEVQMLPSPPDQNLFLPTPLYFFLQCFQLLTDRRGTFAWSSIPGMLGGAALRRFSFHPHPTIPIRAIQIVSISGSGTRTSA